MQMMRKGRRADPAKDEAIIEAARALFTERGYSVSIDEVAAAANVSKQTIYARYSSKQDLLAAVVHLTAEDLVSPLSINGAEPEDALTQFGRRFIEVVFDEKKIAMQRLLISQAASFPELGESYYANGPRYVRERLANYIERATAARKLIAHDAALAATQYIGLVIGPDHLARLVGAGDPAQGRSTAHRVKDAVDAFMKLYGPAKAS